MPVMIKIIGQHASPPALGHLNEPAHVDGVVAHGKHIEETPTAAPSDPAQTPPSSDSLAAIAKSIEELPDEMSTLARARELLAKKNQIDLELGGVLNKLFDNGWYGAPNAFYQRCGLEMALAPILAFELGLYYVASGTIDWAAQGVEWATIRRIARDSFLEAVPDWPQNIKIETGTPSN